MAGPLGAYHFRYCRQVSEGHEGDVLLIGDTLASNAPPLSPPLLLLLLVVVEMMLLLLLPTSTDKDAVPYVILA